MGGNLMFILGLFLGPVLSGRGPVRVRGGEQIYHVKHPLPAEATDVTGPVHINKIGTGDDKSYTALLSTSSLQRFARDAIPVREMVFLEYCAFGDTALSFQICDGIVHCIEGYDETNCHNNSCPPLHFRCESGNCKATEVVCNGVQDCSDGSDELHCSNYTCPEDFFQCNSGQCILEFRKCDGYIDCKDESDEAECQDIVCPEGYYECPNGQCLSRAFLCEWAHFVGYGNAYCTEAKNLVTCDNYTCKDQNTFQCESGHCIPRAGRCNARRDCPDLSDEMHCENHSCEFQGLWFRCDNGQCISKQWRCNNISECLDGSDEIGCASNDCGSSPFYTCADGSCAFERQICDTRKNCRDGSDEVNCTIDTCPIGEYMCKTGECKPLGYGKCNGLISEHKELQCALYNDEEDQCAFTKCPSDYMRTNAGACVPVVPLRNTCGNVDVPDICPFRCFTGSIQCCNCRCVHRNSICDGVLDCPDGADERNCGIPECRNDQFYCDDKICLPLLFRCDGFVHCSDGRDEIDCKVVNNSQIPIGKDITSIGLDYLNALSNHKNTCYNESICLSIAELCEDFTTCPLQEELVKCHFACDNHEPCRCSSGLVNCTNSVASPWPEDIVWPFPKADVHFYYGEFSLYTFEKISELILKNTSLTHVPTRILQCAYNINYLDLSNNLITYISSGDFGQLYRLFKLDLSANLITSIDDYTFKGMRVYFLSLANNRLSDFGVNLFGGMAADGKIYTDEFRLCCLRPSNLPEENCFPRADQFSSCEDLMRDNVLRAFLWIIGSASLVGNVYVIISKLATDRQSMLKNYGFLVFNLAIADILMGVYMLSIASVDLMYRGIYFTKDAEWRNSIWCKLAGALCMTSSEASVLFICLITIDRYIVLKYTFGQVRISSTALRGICICIWIIAVAFAIIPVVVTPYFEGRFFSTSGVCVALPLTTESFYGWEYSFAISVGLNCILFVFVGLGQCLIYKEIAFSAGHSLVSTKRKNDYQIARRLMFVVLSDFFCWVPIGVFGLMAFAGVAIPSTAYAWTIIFVLPINSALNPFLYTVTTLFSTCKRHQKALDGTFTLPTELEQIN